MVFGKSLDMVSLDLTSSFIKNVLYTKMALGKGYQPFTVYKFRTMYQGADKVFEEVVRSNGLNSTGQVNHDPRTTPLGKLLRHFFADETPQLYNIARREMKLVGIRPKTSKEWEMYPEEHMQRSLQERPGLLPPAYYEPGLGSFEEKIRAEERYMDLYEKYGQDADVEYRNGIICNLLFRGVRGK